MNKIRKGDEVIVKTGKSKGQRGTVLEVCPWSNVSLGVYRAPGEVPLRRLVEAGARVPRVALYVHVPTMLVILVLLGRRSRNNS